MADNHYDGLIGNEPWRATISRNGTTTEIVIECEDKHAAHNPQKKSPVGTRTDGTTFIYNYMYLRH